MRAIIATNPEGNDFLYRSITEFRNEHKVSPPTIDRALKLGKSISRGKLKGWAFKYYVVTPIDTQTNQE